jgi:hypothetical protein
MQLFRRKIVCIVCIAQHNYAPFSKNRREIFTIQKRTDRRPFHLYPVSSTLIAMSTVCRTVRHYGE